MLLTLCRKSSYLTRCKEGMLTKPRIAGSETTATALATITWYLAHNPAILAKLQHEIRSNFQTYAQINAQSTSGLRYLHAVCLEALRVYPPLPLGLPRIVPEGGGLVDGQYVPGGVRRSLSQEMYRLILSRR